MKIITFIDYASRVWLLDCSKLAVSWKKGNGVTIFWSDVIMNFFWSSIFLVKCSHWSKFHVNIITSSGVMAISVYKRLTRKLEVKNTNVWVLPKIWRMGWVRATKFDTSISNKTILNAAKGHGYSFYSFWVIKGKPYGNGY